VCGNCPTSRLRVGSYCTQQEKLSTDRVLAHCERSPRPQSVSHATDRDTADTDRQPFRTADADALGMSVKTLQGSRFRITKGVYVAATTDVSHYIRGIYLGLAAAHNRDWCDRVSATRCCGWVSGPHDICDHSSLAGPASRRQGDAAQTVASPPERCRCTRALLAQSGLHIESPRPRHGRGLADPAGAYHLGALHSAVQGYCVAGRCGPCRGEIGTGTRGLPTRDLAAALLGAGRAADMQSCHRG